MVTLFSGKEYEQKKRKRVGITPPPTISLLSVCKHEKRLTGLRSQPFANQTGFYARPANTTCKRQTQRLLSAYPEQ